MKRTFAAIGIAIAATAFVAITSAPAPALAEDKISEWIDDETGDVIELYSDNGKAMMVVHHADGGIEVWHESNPNPDDNGKGTSRPDVKALLKLAHLAYKVHKNAEDTPLGAWTTEGGKGRGPHWNPGDDQGNNGPGGAPNHSGDYSETAKEKADQIKAANAKAATLNRIGGSMGSGDEGGSENAPGLGNHGGGKGGSGNGSGSYQDRQNKTIGKTESLGPHPEVVNPPPKSTGGGN